jgi:hypothetical protein
MQQALLVFLVLPNSVYTESLLFFPLPLLNVGHCMTPNLPLNCVTPYRISIASPNE